MLSSLRADGPLVVVDGGNALRGPARSRPQALPQERAVAEGMAEGLAAGGLDAMALGEQDWRLGSAWVRGVVARHGLPVLAANLVCAGVSPFRGGVVVERDGARLGIVGLTHGEVDGCEVGDPSAAAAAALASLGEVDAAILLAPLPEAALRPLASLGFELVIDGVERVPTAHGVGFGDGWRAWNGAQGKHLGIARLGLRAGADGLAPVDAAGVRAARRERLMEDLRAAREAAEGSPHLATRRRAEAEIPAIERELAALDAESAGPAPARHALRLSFKPLSEDLADDPVAAAIARRAAEAVAAAEPGPATPLGDGPRRAEAGPFAGSDACASCHAGPALQWAGTPHAGAWATLEAAGGGHDRRCLPCHVTGWEAPGGPSSAAEAGPLRDVQCEACHGPAAAHVAAPEDPTRRPIRAPDEPTCRACHDGERDNAEFDPATYHPRVVHADLAGQEAEQREQPREGR